MAKQFDVPLTAKKTMKSIKWDAISRITLEKWSNWIDLRKLELLEAFVPSQDFYDYATRNRMFESLKHLTLTTNCHTPALGGSVDHFIANCGPLESLSLTNAFGRVELSTILTVHGPTLKSLAIHNLESLTTGLIRNSFSTSDILSVRSSCPKLEAFELDINRTTLGLAEEAAYDALATLPRLRKVLIHMDMGISAPSNIREEMYPIVDSDFAVAIWTIIQDGKVRNVLDELLLFVGEPDGPVALRQTALWIKLNQEGRQQFLVTKHEGNDPHGGLRIVTGASDPAPEISEPCS